MADRLPRLRWGHVYRLSGITKAMWQVGHPRYGRPDEIVGIYIGQARGTRRWFSFEIHVGGKEQGTIHMPEDDLAQLTVQHLGAYWSETHGDRARTSRLQRGAGAPDPSSSGD